MPPVVVNVIHRVVPRILHTAGDGSMSAMCELDFPIQVTVARVQV